MSLGRTEKRNFLGTIHTEAEGKSKERVLTPRQKEILQLVAGGLSNEEIASRLGISKKTARIHVCNICLKLDTGSVAGTVISGVNSGIIDVGQAINGLDMGSILNLTRRQKRVMEAVVSNQPYEEIALSLGISRRTVDNHASRIFKVLGVVRKGRRKMFQAIVLYMDARRQGKT